MDLVQKKRGSALRRQFAYRVANDSQFLLGIQDSFGQGTGIFGPGKCDLAKFGAPMALPQPVGSQIGRYTKKISPKVIDRIRFIKPQELDVSFLGNLLGFLLRMKTYSEEPDERGIVFFIERDNTTLVLLKTVRTRDHTLRAFG